MNEGRVRLDLAAVNGDGTSTIETDHVICATGYRADVDRLTFLDAGIRSGLRTVGRSPELSRTFESSVSGLYFVGLSAAVSFGPLMRFMHGDAFAAVRISSHLVESRRAMTLRTRGSSPLSARSGLDQAGASAGARSSG
jgi:hypothetical protein